jgi:hypothetical protein
MAPRTLSLDAEHWYRVKVSAPRDGWPLVIRWDGQERGAVEQGSYIPARSPRQRGRVREYTVRVGNTEMRIVGFAQARQLARDMCSLLLEDD